MRELIRDLRFAARRLAKAPGFTVAVLLTLAIGIGGNAAIFSFVNGILLRPLPYPRPDRLVNLCETNREQIGDWCAASPANAQDWAQRSRTLQAIGLARSWPLSLKTEGRIVGLRGGIATPGVFSAFQVKPSQGRLFESRDMRRGGERVAIVSQSFWSHRLGRSDAVGRPIDLDGDAYQVIGVLPDGFDVPFVDEVDVWIPLWPERQDRREWRGFIPFARLADGASLQQARVEMETIRRQLAAEHPDSNAAWGISVESLHDRITRPVRPALLVFLVAVGLVLLIACANVANMMVARSLTREREHAVRLALGANRVQLIRALLSESLLLSIAGGLVGLLLALWAVDLLVGLAPGWFPRLDGVKVSLPVLGCTALLSLVSTLACGLIPALHSTQVDLMEALKTGRTSGERSRGFRTRSLLVVTEMALALLLLVGAGLLLRSFANLLDWSPGFDRGHVAALQLLSSPGKYPRPEQVTRVFARAAEEVRALPSVVAAGTGSAVPLWGGDGEQEFYVEGRPIPAAGQRPSVAWFDVDEGYFQTLRIPLVRGRYFTAMDRRGAPPVAIVNETMARRYWPDESPIGQRVRLLEEGETFEIVGVVGDVQPFRPDEKPKPQIYWPFAQFPRWAVQLVVRTTGDPAMAAPAIRARLEQADPDLQVGRLSSMDELVDRQLTSPRFIAVLAAIFGVIALGTAAVGIYGVMSFAVVQRTREIGIRMAVGAGRSEILGQMLRKGLLMAACGEAIGLAGALGLTRLLGSMLVGLTPTDVATFAGVSTLLLIVATVACYVPARRATRVDPMIVLRSD
jgi:putative ABC transport system permease protein